MSSGCRCQSRRRLPSPPTARRSPTPPPETGRPSESLDEDEVAVKWPAAAPSQARSPPTPTLACTLDRGNSINTIRLGCHVPSRDSVRPPRAMNRPPYLDTHRRHALVVFIARGVFDVDMGDYVCGHDVPSSRYVLRYRIMCVGQRCSPRSSACALRRRRSCGARPSIAA